MKTCCGRPEAVFWNPLNGVVQCHACGHVYTPERDRLSVWLHNWWMRRLNARRERDGSCPA